MEHSETSSACSVPSQLDEGERASSQAWAPNQRNRRVEIAHPQGPFMSRPPKPYPQVSEAEPSLPLIFGLSLGMAACPSAPSSCQTSARAQAEAEG